MIRGSATRGFVTSELPALLNPLSPFSVLGTSICHRLPQQLLPIDLVRRYCVRCPRFSPEAGTDEHVFPLELKMLARTGKQAGRQAGRPSGYMHYKLPLVNTRVYVDLIRTWYVPVEISWD